MFKNYFKTAWRNILRSRGYSALNIFGLAMGMAVALLVGLWVKYQYSYDRFLPDYQQAYQVARNFNSNGEQLTFTSTSLKLADKLRNDFPEIEYVAETDWFGPHDLIVGDKKFYISGGQVGKNFLQIFSFPLIEGNASTILNDPYSIVLTESTAKSLFGNENPIGKTVRFDNADNLKVTGLLKDVPENSTFRFKYLVPFSYQEGKYDYIKEARHGNFSYNSFQIFARLKQGSSPTGILQKIKNIEKTETDNINAMMSEVILQPLKDWHLHAHNENDKDTVGLIEYVHMFSIIGILVLIIACVNFINLTTARSEKRAKEVGVRKAIGSRRIDLIKQFLTESLLMAFVAFCFSIILVALALPSFNILTGCNIEIPFFSPLFWTITLISIFITGLLAGTRPAFYLSSFNAVKVLKGTIQNGKGATFSRKILVVLQFTCSVALIISTIVIYQQIQYAKNRPSGYNANRLMTTDMNGDLYKNFVSLKNDLIQKGIAESVSTASSPATGVNSHSDIDQWPGKLPGETVEMGVIAISDDYFKTLEIPIISGRDFININDTLNVIFNEEAVKRLRIKNPINQFITLGGAKLRIIGITKDALMVSPFQPADPSMFLYQPATSNMVSSSNIMMYRLSKKSDTRAAIKSLNTLFNQYNPAFPYTYEFVDQNYASKFNLEILIGKLAGIFALLAIFISCLGLLGLAAYVAEQRTKEIGIRKVLGATVAQVWFLLSGNFILMVLVSCAIASPVAYYFLQNWLQKYSYRITINPIVFFWAAIVAILITVVTISFQAIRAATANPTRSLRSE
jgi:putative ABC transport system permease protein